MVFAIFRASRVYCTIITTRLSHHAHLKSPYPDTPEFPESNATLLLRPGQAQWSDESRGRGFKDFVQRVKWAATALGSPVDKGGLGLSSDNGDMIGIMSGNCMPHCELNAKRDSQDYITFAQACFYIMTPFALISSYSKPFELKNTLALSRATCLFIDEKFLSMALPIAKEIGLPSTMIFIMTGDAPGHKNFSQLIDEARTKKLEYCCFKSVMISHGNLLGVISQNSLLAEQGQKSTKSNELLRVSAFLSQPHASSVMYILLMLLSPTPTIMSPRNIDIALDLISKHRPKLANADLITAVGSGAAYLSPKLAEKLFSFLPQKVDFMEGPSRTQTASPSPGSLGGRLNPKQGSTGVLLPNLIARIVREDGTEADVNEVGELWIKGPTVSLGYWNNEKANKETFVDGWLKTGDKFRVDEDGYFLLGCELSVTLSFTGRAKLIEDVTVAGVSGDRTLDEQVIVLTDEGKKLAEAIVRKELERWSQENPSKYKWLRGGIEIMNEISKSPTGKALRKELQDMFEQRLVYTKKAMSKL
ncbi:hypothetical protein M378DRAFT_177653 [Amanita muscaria Koide BX008]|uniref:AMP-dependent synthetase/ligase domain-containing protein n=1 Tax=Amanita muscaria (strain Koide BX008) TaxID=946122 RepID=A0A0C2WYD1_AMAMK|nr:hypothetical protein M378DRAFT_177653 [Amanita muscaria Koide BX008]